MLRAKNLQKELCKELRDGEKYLTMFNINSLMSDLQAKERAKQRQAREQIKRDQNKHRN